MLHGLEADEKIIPPIAHFIWAGGLKILPNDGIDLIASWISNNTHTQGFQAWLWIDKKTAPNDVVFGYQKFFSKKGITVFDETAIVQSMTLILKDITVSGFRDEFVSYEIDKLRPNYGSSSDLLRYEILAKYGGFYCDCTDVGPGVTPLSDIFNKNFSRDTIYVDHCPQQPHAPVAKLQVFGINELGNDTFIVTTGNQAMSKVLDKARENYNFSVLGLTVDHIIEAHSGSNLKNITIKRTGPGLVRQVLLGDISCQQQEDGSLVSGDKKAEVRRVRDGVVELTKPRLNTGNWLDVRITPYENSKEAIKVVIKTIQFEATHFKILRLDDHVKDLIESTSGSLTPVQVLKALEETIDNFLEEIKYTQLSMEFSDTIAYVTNKKLKNIFNLPLDACLRAIEAQAMLFDLLYLERIAEANRSQYASKTSSFLPSVETLIISEQRPEIQNRYCIQIKQGLIFFGKVVRNLDKFDSSIRVKIRAHLSARLEKYQEYVLVLHNRVYQENFIDTTLIGHLRVELAAENILAQELQQQTL